MLNFSIDNVKRKMFENWILWKRLRIRNWSYVRKLTLGRRQTRVGEALRLWRQLKAN